jgi:DNA-binding MarR family transcriptional regulator
MPNPYESQEANTSPEQEQPLEVDRLIHEPSRLKIMAALNRGREADFQFLETVTKLQRSNLSMQIAKLEQAGYITIRKYIRGKFAATGYSITPAGRIALAEYLEGLHALQQSVEEQIAKQEQQNQAGKHTKHLSPKTEPGVP